MNALAVVLGVALVVLQFRLWISDSGVRQIRHLEQQIGKLQEQIGESRERNASLEAEVVDLKKGLEAVEEIARQDLEMIKQDELFVQMLPDSTPPR